MKTKLTSLTLGLAACVAMLITAPAGLRAATLTVTSTADSGPGSLRNALKNARSGDTIQFSLPAPAAITLTSGELLVSKNLNIVGPGAENLAINGRSATRVFRVGSRATVTIAGLTIVNGLVAGTGGGIYNDHATLTVSNCVLAGNTAAGKYNGLGGGGIFNDGSGMSGSATLALVSCTFNGNSAANTTSGGAIHNFASSSGRATLTVRDCLFSNNSATYHGGAIINDGTGATATIFSSVFSANSVTGAARSGGALANGLGTMTVRDSTLHGNLAGSRGGGIYSYLGVLDIVGSTLSANGTATYEGGGVYGFRTAITVANSTLSGNAADTLAGGIYNYNGTLSVTGSTLTGNSAQQIGGIFSVGPLTLGSTILNNALGGNVAVSGGTATSLGYNLSSDSGNGWLTQATDLLNTDPMLGPLHDNGGPTLTHAPLPGSPAIDQGKNFSGSTADQRGFFRTMDFLDIANAPEGDGTDIGAVEVQ